MAWDLKIDQTTGDLASGYVTGQDEIIQRVVTRLRRHLREWFVNTDCGLPWYEGPSAIDPETMTQARAILGNRDLRYADLWIRNEIAETNGVMRIVDFNTAFDSSARVYSIRAQILTKYGLPYLIKLDTTLNPKKPDTEAA